MFDIWLGDTELTTFTLLFSCAVLLPVQLLLCFKIKSLVVRLLPVMLLSIPMLCFFVLSAAAAGWDSLGYLFLAIFAAFMLFICGVGWAIWAIARFARSKR